MDFQSLVSFAPATVHLHSFLYTWLYQNILKQLGVCNFPFRGRSIFGIGLFRLVALLLGLNCKTTVSYSKKFRLLFNKYEKMRGLLTYAPDSPEFTGPRSRPPSDSWRRRSRPPSCRVAIARKSLIFKKKF